MKRRGFTLIEFIIYIGLATFFIVASLNFVWMIIGDEIKQERLSEVNDGGVFILKKITYHVQRADEVDTQTVFDTHPGKLVLNTTGGQITLDTYQKSIALGSAVVAITKLRMIEGLNPAVDLTSDKVDAKNFTVNNFSASGVTTIRINLTLESVNPTGGATYEAENSWTTSATIRKK